jgi:arylsulfatase A-like enzyme
LCSPSRGSLFTGRYPHSNGLLGLAHHGWEYRADVRTLPQIVSEAGWYTALFGMKHETSYSARLGFDEFDVSNSYCEYVVERATQWLTGAPPQPFLLTAGFFETHRPYPPHRYQPADRDVVTVPKFLPETDDVRRNLAEFYGAISVADAAVGQLLDTLAATGLDRSTWVVFMTDHCPALPRAKSTLYDAGTGIAMIVRPPLDSRQAPRVYDDLFSGVDLVPTLLELLNVDLPTDIEGLSHADSLRTAAKGGKAVGSEVYTTKTYHDSFDPIRAIRTKEYSYIENYANRPLLDLPWDIADSAPGKAVAPFIGEPRPERELRPPRRPRRVAQPARPGHDGQGGGDRRRAWHRRRPRLGETMAASAYLVLASQRSGSTLLVESLRATGVAGEFFQYLPTTSQSPQPRQWFEGV